MTAPGFGLYVHIPFCLSRCSYCSFNSGIYQSELADAYLDALAQECAMRGIVSGHFSPTTLYIGGGTPSCLSLSQLDRLLSNLPYPENGREATVECNPDSADDNTLQKFRDYDLNRCSFGVQTFDPYGLRLLGRRHDAEQAKKAVDTAWRMGFTSVSLDLITAWPGQTHVMLEADLRQACDLGVTHISCYQLMLDEKPDFAARLTKAGLRELDDSASRDYWDMTESILSDRGYEHYEVSNFCRPGFACQHNVDIWKGKEYHGIGAGAHSHVGGQRFANVESVTEYIDIVRSGRDPRAFEEKLEPEEKARECAVFWLRLTEGVDLAEFEERTGFSFLDLYREELPKLLGDARLLALEKDGKMVRIKVNPDFYPVLDAILVDLI